MDFFKLRYLLSPLAFSALSLFGADCCEDPKGYRASVSHIEGKGIGYRHGYTSLDLFMSRNYANSLPFVDLRGHIFDDGRLAANVGLGYRYLSPKVALGGNVFYDMRNTGHAHFNQIGLGFEALGKYWDFRINGYLPVGKTKQLYGRNFAGFSGHHLILRRKEEFALKGLDAEGGFYTSDQRALRLYGGIGPYMYEAEGSHAYGGKVRIDLSYKNYISLEFRASYDSLFKEIFQGQITFSLPFGPIRSETGETPPTSCSALQLLGERGVQPVFRSEIIVLRHKKKNEVAINPETGAPFYFIFVDNTSNSEGTFESPYPNLDTAISVSNPYDIFYIYPGDGTAAGLTTTTGFALQNSQQMLGAGYGYEFLTTWGPVLVPPLAEGRPFLNATASPSLLIPTTGNKIAGLHLASESPAEGCVNINSAANLEIINNLIEPTGANATVEAVKISDLNGKLIVQDNTIVGDSDLFNGIAVSTTTSFSVLIQNNSISGGLNGILVSNLDIAQEGSVIIQNNTTSDNETGIGVGSGTKKIVAKINSNTILNSSSANISISTGVTSSIPCFQVQNNSAAGGDGYEISVSAGSFLNLEPFTGNTPSTYVETGSGTINLVPQGTCR